MQLRKMFSGILTAAVSFTAVLCIGQNRSDNPVRVSAAEEPVKIMALGDSITDGYFGTDGYRKYFYHNMTEMGHDIDMVGAKDYSGWNPSYTNSNGVTFEYDGDHSGYSGYAIQYMTGTETRQGLLETVQSTDMIKKCDPDIVLLQIGTNDILSNYNEGIIDRLENLVNVILEDMNDSDDVVFVSTIPYMDVLMVYDWFWSYGEVKSDNSQEDFAKIVHGYVDSYNDQIKQMVTEMQTQGKPVKFADINSVIDPSTDLQDGIHPNETGYQKMGTYWSNLVDNYLSTEPETTTEETTLVDKYKKGDVNTDGEINVSDLIVLQKYLLKKGGILPEQTYYADMDNNNRLNIFDSIQLKRLLILNE